MFSRSQGPAPYQVFFFSPPALHQLDILHHVNCIFCVYCYVCVHSRVYIPPAFCSQSCVFCWSPALPHLDMGRIHHCTSWTWDTTPAGDGKDISLHQLDMGHYTSWTWEGCITAPAVHGKDTSLNHLDMARIHHCTDWTWEG